MACKHFRKGLEAVQETGSMTPNIFKVWYCALGRDVIDDMHRRCSATPYNGPCWQDKPPQQEK